jgi:CheY-like chemotaxis protein
LGRILSPSRDDRTPILIVEDNSGDVVIIRESLRAHGLNGELVVLTDGEKAAQFIDDPDANESAAPPGLIILDLNLPKRHGFDVLRRIRQSPRHQKTPVIVLSSSGARADREAAAMLQATSYLQKTSDLEAFMELGSLAKSVLGLE